MPQVTCRPTAQSGFEKIQSLLPPQLKTYITYSSGKDIVTAVIHQAGFLGFFKNVAEAHVYDHSIIINVYNTNFLDVLKMVAQKFEKGDKRKIDINHWA